MNKTWMFIGGVVAGVVSVFAAVAVATELDNRKGAGNGTVDEQMKLALPEGEGKGAD